MTVFEGTVEVTECYHKCPFWGNTMDGMECNHPYFNDKGAYENMIISQNNSRGRVPDECPLRKKSYFGNFIIKLPSIPSPEPSKPCAETYVIIRNKEDEDDYNMSIGVHFDKDDPDEPQNIPHFRD